MDIREQVVNLLKEKTEGVQELSAEIRKLEDRKKNDHLDARYIQSDIEPKIGELRWQRRNRIDAAAVALRDLAEGHRQQIQNSNRLKGEELNDDARLFAFPGLLKPEDVEAIMDRNQGNHTVLQMAARYAEQNGMKINRVYDSGKAAAIANVNDLEGAGKLYIDHWIDKENANEMLTKFFG